MENRRLQRQLTSLLVGFAFAFTLIFAHGGAWAARKHRDPVDAANDRSATTEQQAKAVRGLGKSKDPRAIDALLKRLDCKCDEIVDAATDALRELKAAPVLEKRLLDRNFSVEDRVLALLGLRALKAQSSVTPLAQMLKDENPRLRQAAALSLGVIDPAKAEAALIAALSDDDATVRWYVISAIRGVPTAAVKQAIEARIPVETDASILSELRGAKAAFDTPVAPPAKHGAPKS